VKGLAANPGHAFSGENLFVVLLIDPSSQELGSPAIPGRFSLHWIEWLMRQQGLRARPRRYGLPKDQGEPRLSSRELQILELVALGHSAKEVAQKCGLTFQTAETHLDTMRLKLRARNRTHVVAMAIKLGLLPKSEFQARPPLAA
jgi:DNA-binding CsgD family transcriptional regulator